MKRHETNVFSLMAGLTFTGIAAVYLIASVNGLSVNGRIVIPTALIALGLAGLAGAVARRARRSKRPPTAAQGAAAGAAESPLADSARAGSPPAGSPLAGLARDLEALGLLDDGAHRPPEH